MSNQPPTGAQYVDPQQAHDPSAPPPPPLPGEAPTVDESPHPFVPVNFWQLPLVQNVLPLLTAIVLHMALLVVLIIAYEPLMRFIPQVREQIIIPDAGFVGGEGDIGGLPHPGLGGDPNRDSSQDNVETPANADGWAERPSQTVSDALMGAGAADNRNDTVIGRGEGAGFGHGFRTGAGSADSSGLLANFGIPGGGSGIAPRSPFLGIGGNATRVVYLCDASGTMITSFDFLQRELRRAVSVLRPIQLFNVIFFRDDVANAFSTDGLVPATTDNKQKANTFITATHPYGGTKPIPAIELAFAQQPQLIYVLTDGFDNVDNYDLVVQTFRRLNPDKQVKVNTILIQGRKDTELENVLRKIASENGGTFKAINLSDFDR